MVLGGGMSSRLFQEVREKRGLCYSIYAFSSNFQDGGFTGIYVGTSQKDAGEVSAVIAGEMEALTAHITDAELARAKAQLKSGLLMGLERPGTRSENIAGQLFALGRVTPMAEIVEKLEATTAEDVKRFAAFTMRAPSIAALGPIGKLEAHAKFAARFSPLQGTKHAAE
jgi:predicted Zn-dependent peptidase